MNLLYKKYGEQSKAYSKKYYRNHKEEQKARVKRYDEEHKEVRDPYYARYRKEHRGRIGCNGYRAQIKEIVLKHGKCDKCGFSDVRALVIHHYFPVGAERKKNQGAVLRDIINKKVPFSILCSNCHVILHNPRKFLRDDGNPVKRKALTAQK
jgi:hypothetical protein